MPNSSRSGRQDQFRGISSSPGLTRSYRCDPIIDPGVWKRPH